MFDFFILVPACSLIARSLDTMPISFKRASRLFLLVEVIEEVLGRESVEPVVLLEPGEGLLARFVHRQADEATDRTPELDIEQCFECGLCAVVCTARRPLLQYIRLAKNGLEVPV